MTLPYVIWILISVWLVCSGWILSAFHRLNALGYLVSLGLLGSILLLTCRCREVSAAQIRCVRPGLLILRFRRPLPMIYFTYLFLSLAGGTLWSPSNYDALCYRLPRILHWWSQSGWHWIGGYNIRMDYSAAGFEWLATPLLILSKSDRLIFLINLIAYSLMPGLVFLLFRMLGLGRRVAWSWMWILPTAYCFVLQAGSIGNDLFATDYFLASAFFALRAAKLHSWSDAVISLLSAGLMTGTKASNIPLLLPLGLCIIPLGSILIAKPIRIILAVIIVGLVSFLPTAFMNLHYAGDWSGDPSNSEKMKLSDPFAGLGGNALQLLEGAFSPSVFPNAKKWTTACERMIDQAPLSAIKAHYPRFTLSVGELATEEGAGLGPGILILCLVALVFALMPGHGQGITGRAMVFGMLCWVAILAFMAKLGSESAARLAAPYYAGLVVPFIAFRSHEALARRRWWRYLAVLCCLSVLPAVIFSPSRPIFPTSKLIEFAGKTSLPTKLLDRLAAVYAVYGKRSDSLALVREHIPKECRVIGFAGKGNESEYSLWKPIGQGIRVVDLGNGNQPLGRNPHIDCIVGSEIGIRERFATDATGLAEIFQGNVLWSGKIDLFASHEPSIWHVILTGKAETTCPIARP
jgi:hypothetical protein